MLNKLMLMFTNKHYRSFQNWEINFDELREKTKNGALLVDVRSVQEYNEGHLDGAIQLADFEIGQKYKTVLPNKEKEIVLYCQNGGRSKHAYKKLKNLGYKNVFSLYGGLDNIN